MKPFVQEVTREMASHAGGGDQAKLIYLLVLWFFTEVQQTRLEKRGPSERMWRVWRRELAAGGRQPLHM